MPRDQYRRLRLTLPERPTPTIKRLLVTMLGCVTMPSWPIRPPTLQEMASARARSADRSISREWGRE